MHSIVDLRTIHVQYIGDSAPCMKLISYMPRWPRGRVTINNKTVRAYIRSLLNESLLPFIFLILALSLSLSLSSYFRSDLLPSDFRLLADYLRVDHNAMHHRANDGRKARVLKEDFRAIRLKGGIDRGD